MFTALQGIRSAHREPWPGGPQEFPAGAPRCIVCGCTNERRCAGGCSWYVVAHASRRGLCTACLGERLCGVGGYLALLNAKGDDVVTFRTSCHCPVCRWVVAEAELRAGAGPRPMCRGEVQS